MTSLTLASVAEQQRALVAALPDAIMAVLARIPVQPPRGDRETVKSLDADTIKAAMAGVMAAAPKSPLPAVMALDHPIDRDAMHRVLAEQRALSRALPEIVLAALGRLHLQPAFDGVEQSTHMFVGAANSFVAGGGEGVAKQGEFLIGGVAAAQSRDDVEHQQRFDRRDAAAHVGEDFWKGSFFRHVNCSGGQLSFPGQPDRDGGASPESHVEVESFGARRKTPVERP